MNQNTLFSSKVFPPYLLIFTQIDPKQSFPQLISLSITIYSILMSQIKSQSINKWCISSSNFYFFMKYTPYFLVATSLEEELPQELESSNKHLGWKSEVKKNGMTFKKLFNERPTRKYQNYQDYLSSKCRHKIKYYNTKEEKKSTTAVPLRVRNENLDRIYISKHNMWVEHPLPLDQWLSRKVNMKGIVSNTALSKI